MARTNQQSARRKLRRLVLSGDKTAAERYLLQYLREQPDDDFMQEELQRLQNNTKLLVTETAAERRQRLRKEQLAAISRITTSVPVSSFGCLASQSESGNIGIIPAQLNPVWVDTPINLLLAETGIFRKTTAANTEGLDNSLKIKVQDNYIIFQHPLSGKRIMLPALYENIVLEIGGKKYRMPQIQRKSNAGSIHREQKTSVWE